MYSVIRECCTVERVSFGISNRIGVLRRSHTWGSLALRYFIILLSSYLSCRHHWYNTYQTRSAANNFKLVWFLMCSMIKIYFYDIIMIHMNMIIEEFVFLVDWFSIKIMGFDDGPQTPLLNHTAPWRLEKNKTRTTSCYNINCNGLGYINCHLC